MGTPLLERLAQTEDPKLYQTALDVIYQHEMAGAALATWIPGAEECLQALTSANIPLALFTRNMRQATELTMQRLAIPIELVVTRDDFAAKPDPAGLLHIALTNILAQKPLGLLRILTSLERHLQLSLCLIAVT